MGHGGERVLRDDRESKGSSERVSKILGEEHRGGIRDGHEERSAGELADRQGHEMASKVLAQEFRDAEIDVRVLELDEGELVLLRDDLCHLLASDQPALDEQVAEPASREPLPTLVALLVEDGLEILLADEPVSQEQYAQCRPGMVGRFHQRELSAPCGAPFTDGENPRVRAVVQRVREAAVSVEGEIVAACGHGVLVLLGIATGDGVSEAEWIAGKVARLRIFENVDGRFDRSLLDVGGEALVVSQFTLIADTRKGNRPSFAHAAPPDHAEPLYEAFCDTLELLGVTVRRGVFGARMDLALVNDGPVTIVLDTGS